MKRIMSVSMAAILTVIILLYTQIHDFVPAQTQENEIPQDSCSDIAEKNRDDRTENPGTGESISGSAGEITGGDDFNVLREEEKKVLLAYAEYLKKYYEEKPQYADRMKFDLVYIDADDIPELAIIPSDVYVHDGVHIYAYHDGNVKMAGSFGSFGKCRFKPYANLIFSSHTYADEVYADKVNETMYFYRFAGTECIMQQSFFHHPQYGEQEYVGEIYGLDRRLVSEEEYNEAWKRWNVAELDVWGYEDAVLVRDIDDLYGEMCIRHSNVLAQGGAENCSGDVTIGWNRQFFQFFEESGEADLSISGGLGEADALIIKITSGCTPDLSFLEDMSHLTELDISFGPEADLSYLGCLTGLEQLSMTTWGADSADLSFLRELNQLTEIYADRLCEVEDLSYFQHMVHLKSLNLSYVEDVDLNDLANLKNLEELEIAGSNIRNPEGLAGLTQLKTLSLCDTSLNAIVYNGEGRPVLDLYPLEKLSKLEWVVLQNIHIDDISPLAGLWNLHSICLANSGVEDISPLRDMGNLSDLAVFGNVNEQVKEQADKYFPEMEYMVVTEEIPPNL